MNNEIFNLDEITDILNRLGKLSFFKIKINDYYYMTNDDRTIFNYKILNINKYFVEQFSSLEDMIEWIKENCEIYKFDKVIPKFTKEQVLCILDDLEYVKGIKLSLNRKHYILGNFDNSGENFSIITGHDKDGYEDKEIFKTKRELINWVDENWDRKNLGAQYE